MKEYSLNIHKDGATILKGGIPLETEEVMDFLRKYENMEKALLKIHKWFGEFPPIDQTYDDKKTPMSYGAAYGSNGERDYMRSVASKALT